MIHGVINIYKEKGYTSHDVVAKLRGILKQKKIGQTAQWYMTEKKIGVETPCRFDVIGILGEKITWVRDAFWIC